MGGAHGIAGALELFLEFVMALFEVGVVVIELAGEWVGELEVAAGLLQGGQEVHDNFIANGIRRDDDQ